MRVGGVGKALRTEKLVALVIILVVGVACSSKSRLDPFGNDAPRREQITEMTYEGDCQGLEEEFNRARAADDEAIMVYLDEHADEAGCFPEGSSHFMDGA